MNTFRRELMEKALGEDVVSFKEQLLRALTVSPDNCDALKGEIERLFSDFPTFGGTSESDDPPSADAAQSPSDDWTDYRFRSLLVRQFRKFGLLDKKDGFYGLSLSSSDKVDAKYASAFLLGDNGSGKSSLFDAIEYACTGRIGEAEYRCMKDLPWYYHHSMSVEPDIRLQTASGDYDLTDHQFMKESGLDVRRFFFSENSIYVLSTFMNSSDGIIDWVPFFSYMLGLEDILGFLDANYRGGTSELSLYDELKGKLMDIKLLLGTNVEDERERVSRYVSNATTQLTQPAQERILGLLDFLKKTYEQCDKIEDISGVLLALKEQIPDDITYIRSLNQFRSFIEKAVHSMQEGADLPLPFNPDSEHKRLPLVEVETLKNRILEMSDDINVILRTSENKNIPFDEISRKVNNYLRLERFLNLSSKQTEELDIDNLLDTLDKLKSGIEKALPSILQAYLDDNFRSVITDTLQQKFIRKGETLSFAPISKGTICESYGIELAVNGIPVNKYFNTFRFRLFCLCILAAINFKTMQREKILFPFVFDDVFYANDYKNKAQLFRFFEVLADAAEKMLSDRRMLQIVFFTHDEQFVSTLFRRKMPFESVRMARLLDSDDVVSLGREMKEEGITFYPLSKDFKRKVQYGE